MNRLHTVSIEDNRAEVPDVYTKAEVDQLLADVTGVTFEVVTSLPTTGNPGTIYLLRDGWGNTYTMYAYVDGAWRQVSSTMDLSNYYTKAQADNKFYPYEGGTVNGNVTVKSNTNSDNNHIAIGGTATTGSNYIDQYDSGYRVRVWPNALSADRNIRYPNASGTLALTSDIVTPTYYNTSEATVFVPNSSTWTNQYTDAYSMTLPSGIYMMGGYARATYNGAGYYGFRLAYNPDSPTSMGVRFNETKRLDGGGQYKYITVAAGIKFSSQRVVFPSVFQTNSAADGVSVTMALWAIRLGDA